MQKLRSLVGRAHSEVYRLCDSYASHGMDREIARRNSIRGQGKYLWLTAEESVVAGDLAKIIVPSDDETPGLDDIDVLGPSAVEMLDKLLRIDQWKQMTYARGLLAFDCWAETKHGCIFSKLDENSQAALFREAQRYCERLLSGSKMTKLWRTLSEAIWGMRGRYLAAQLYPVIRRDFLRVFYTSRVSWIWLEYDGPPMDEGYPRLVPRR